MPFLAPSICACGKVVAAGTRCECRKASDRERKARHDATRPSARQRGYTSKWEQARADYLTAHPTCVRCGAPAKVVDHIKPHRGDLKLFWSRSNWQPLCVPCHSRTKQSEERRNG